MSAPAVPAPGGRTRQLGGDFAAMAAGVVLRGALATVVSIVIARALAPAAMGRYTFLVWLAGLLPVVLSLGVPTTITRYTAEAIGGDRPGAAGALLVRLVGAQLALSVAVSVALAAVALAPAVGAGWGVPLALAAACVPLLVLQGSATALLSGLQRFRRQALVGVGTLAVQAALTVVAARLAPDVRTFMAVHVAVNTLAVLALGLAAWRAAVAAGVLPPAPAVSAGLSAAALRYTGSVSAIMILDTVVWQRSEVAFLQALSAPEQVAFYALAFGIASQISRLPYQASIVLFPEFPRLVGAGRADEIASLHATAMRYFVLLGAPLAVGLAVVAPFLVHVFYGAGYAPAGGVLALLALGSLPAYLAGASPAVLHAIRREDRLLRQAVVAAVVNLGLAAALTPLGGAAGAAVANVVAQGLGSALAIRAAVVVGGAAVPTAALARIGGAALLMGAAAAIPVSMLAGVPGLVAAVLTGALAYPVALRVCRALTVEDLARARVLAQRLPDRARAGGLAVAAYLCRGPVPEPWSASR